MAARLLNLAKYLMPWTHLLVSSVWECSTQVTLSAHVTHLGTSWSLMFAIRTWELQLLVPRSCTIEFPSRVPVRYLFLLGVISCRAGREMSGARNVNGQRLCYLVCSLVKWLRLESYSADLNSSHGLLKPFFQFYRPAGCGTYHWESYFQIVKEYCKRLALPGCSTWVSSIARSHNSM